MYKAQQQVSLMEILGWIVVALIIIACLVEAFKTINLIRFLVFLILGGIALAFIFNFTSEGIFVIIIAYAILLVISVIFASFKSTSKSN